MLPDENRLDDELVEQVGGGSLDVPELDEATSYKEDSISKIPFICKVLRIRGCLTLSDK